MWMALDRRTASWRPDRPRYRSSVNLTIKDNFCFVAGDLYTKPANPPRRRRAGAGTNSRPHHALRATLPHARFSIDVTLNNYQGRVAVSRLALDYLGDQPDPSTGSSHTGTRPVSVVYVGNMFLGPTCLPRPNLKCSQAAAYGYRQHRRQLGGAEHGRNFTVPNRIPANGMQEAAAALDHFRELGEMDLILNQGFVRA